MIDELFELIVGEEGLIVTLRCDNKFNEEKYFEIKQKLEILIFEWKKQQAIPKKAMLAIVELIECLAGGSRFWEEEEMIKVEDASIEIKEIVNELYETI